ncbi:DUF2057 domain-containing protein [Photobacterium gaetbulicola]|uniref:DUF2057 domain-containing protein n=1 Tax=Photobacterium gaetbulicola Gung47 TaxID=658445 RepID=A0A0C5WT65_9GAMM|nr:DUF2057 family protein [Photobacterium gaetbulicola]AJR09597.1 hypothetical protein H744_2c2946 [Photobacterium gaetbulicola Gung47]PSU14391.1 DUF2057 domain-containing protein [Photobacterium gaetbulicola]
MKVKLKTWLGMAALLMATNSQAAVNVSFDRDVELLAINGKPLGAFSKAPSKIELDDGPNQLITRVSKLVSYNGEFKKFLTQPVVLTFNVSDSDLNVSASRSIIREDQIKGFDKEPSFRIEKAGNYFSEFHQAVLPRGAGIVRDYERELDDYNLEQGFVAAAKVQQPTLKYGETTMAVTATTAVATPSARKPSTALSTDQALILLQADFLRLPAEKRAAFIDWVVQQ